MTVKKLLRMGDERLLSRSVEVGDTCSDSVQSVIADLIDSMHHYGGGRSFGCVLYPMRINNMRDFGCDDMLWERMTGKPYPQQMKQKLREQWDL